MAKANGKDGHDSSRAEKLKERAELQVTTLRGDVRDAILRMIREMPDHWKKMTGAAQDALIDRIEKASSNLVDEAVDIVAARGREAQVVKLGKITINNGAIKCEFTTPYGHEAIAALGARQNQDVVLVARDTDQFKGEQARAESDNIGDLAIPRRYTPPRNS